jgi:hypothetical protein
VHQCHGAIAKFLPIADIGAEADKDDFLTHFDFSQPPVFTLSLKGRGTLRGGNCLAQCRNYDGLPGYTVTTKFLPTDFLHPFYRFSQAFLGCRHRHPDIAFSRIAKAVPRRGNNTCFLDEMRGK